MHSNSLLKLMLAAFAWMAMACGGPLYKVAPLPSGPPPKLNANTNDFNLAAIALQGDQSLERFEANLPLAGVIVVDVRMANRSAAVVNLAALKFSVRDVAGTMLKPLTPKNALKRVMKYYGNRFYTLDSRQQTRDAYDAIALKLAGQLPSQEERRGILFFETKRDTITLSGLTLSVVGTAAPINLPLQ